MRKSRAMYNPDIEKFNKDDRNQNMRGLEVIWKTDTDNQKRIRAVKVGACSLILANMDATWIAEMRNLHTFFTKVTPRELLYHLAKYGGGLNHPAGVELILSLHKLWDRNPRMNYFIINMEEAQKKLVREKLPI